MSKTFPVPANHGFRLHDGQGIQAVGPQTIEPDPKYPLEGREPKPPVPLLPKEAQPVAQGGDLELERTVAAFREAVVMLKREDEL